MRLDKFAFFLESAGGTSEGLCPFKAYFELISRPFDVSIHISSFKVLLRFTRAMGIIVLCFGFCFILFHDCYVHAYQQALVSRQSLGSVSKFDVL